MALPAGNLRINLSRFKPPLSSTHCTYCTHTDPLGEKGGEGRTTIRPFMALLEEALYMPKPPLFEPRDKVSKNKMLPFHGLCTQSVVS